MFGKTKKQGTLQSIFGGKKMRSEDWGDDVRSFELEVKDDGSLKAKERTDVSSIVGLRF